MPASLIGSGRVARERSHTDPGHVSRIPSRSPHIQTTPRVPPPVFTFPTPGRESRQIPLNRGYDSSGSELNLQTDRGRALFVTNAVIVPSSSSSSEDVETSQPPPYVRASSPAWPSHTSQRKHPYGGRSAQSGVGLGLGTPENMGNAYSRATTLVASRPNADIENEYNSDPGDDDPLVVSSSASSARLRSLVLNRQISRPNDLNRNISSTSRDALPNPWDHKDAKPSEGDQRRRELIELVNGMDNGFLGSARTYEYDNLSDDEYTGEQGLAISPSDDFDNNMHTTLKPRDDNRTYLRRRSPVAGQTTSRHQPNASTFSSERTEYSPQRNSSSIRAKDHTTEASRRNQDAELSPLSEYSGDEDAQYLPNRTISPSSQRARISPLTEDRSLFKSTHEGDHPLSPRESSGRAPSVGVALPNSTHLRTSDSARSSEKTLRTSREPSTTSSYKSNYDKTRNPGGIRDLNRARKCKGTQHSPRMRNNPLPHADSSSSIESLRWQHEDQTISLDAEAIFEQLGTERQSAAHDNSPRLSRRQGKGLDFPTNRFPKPSSPRETPNSLPQPTADQSNNHVSRAYEPDVIQQPRRDERNSQASDFEQRTWLSTVSSSAYHSLLDRYGDVEIERQQIIWDLCEAERVFVRRLQTFVRLFICPLRMKDSVTWLTGVPPEVARLFDWLEDIINLHAQISSALRAIVSEQYPIVMRVAGRLRSFVSRLEVHQPYVVRLESTTLLIKQLSGESSNDFGEFIRIQQEQDECHGWSVEAFLVEPVNRLVDYPIHFKVRTGLLRHPSQISFLIAQRLLDVTPQGHPDHLATFSLLHCTETIIRVMREVKLQEEEYELVKDRLEHIKGLPASLQLAHRSRRLLARGRLERENPRGKARPATVSRDLEEHRRSHHAAGVRQSRLISVIQSRAMRSDSIRTTSESNNSMGSHFSDDLQGKLYPSDFFRHSPSTSSLARQDVWERQFTSPRNAPPIPEARTETLYILVFNDLVLFASPIFDTSTRHDREMPGDSWSLIEGIGISRVLKVIEDSSQIVLDLLPVDPENIATGRIPDSGQVITLSLSVPSVSSSEAQLDMAGLSRLRNNWVSAFQECAGYTLRALSFPTESGKLAAPTPGLVWDSKPQTSVSAIVASGLPLPKSPSAQMAEQGADPTEQEREARGWWGLRFHQVLREMQRGLTASGVLTTSAPKFDGDAAGKPPISQSRVLKPSSLSSFESVANRLS